MGYWTRVCVCCCRRRCCCMTKNSHTQENCVTLKEISRFSVERQPKKKVYCIKFGTDSEAVRERNGVKVITITSWYESRVLSIKMVLWRWQLIASQSVIRLLSIKTLIHRCIWMEQLALEQNKKTRFNLTRARISNREQHESNNKYTWKATEAWQTHSSAQQSTGTSLCVQWKYIWFAVATAAAAALCALCVFRTVWWCSILVQVILRATAISICVHFSLSLLLTPASVPKKSNTRVSLKTTFGASFRITISRVIFSLLLPLSCDGFLFLFRLSNTKRKHTETKLHVRINWAENNTIWMAQNTWMAPKKKLRENKLNLNIFWMKYDKFMQFIYLFRQIKMYKLQSQRIEMVSFMSFRASFALTRETQFRTQTSVDDNQNEIEI